MAEPAQLPKREPAHEEPAKTNAVRELGGIREEFIDRVGTLRASLDDSSKVSRNLTFIFLLVGLYIAILGGATDHARLLRGGEIAMPLLNIGVSLVWFYGLAPPLFLLMHFNLLLQLYFLSQKAHRF